MIEKRWAAGGLCAVFALMIAVIGYQQVQMNSMGKQVSDIGEQLQSTRDELKNQIDNVASSGKSPVLSYSAEFVGMNLHQKTAQICVEVTLDCGVQYDDVWIEVNGCDNGGKFPWYTEPLTLRSSEDSSYSANLNLPMDTAGLELVVNTGSKSEVLQTCASIADLLPVQILDCSGNALYNADQRMFYETEGGADLSDPNVVSSAFQFYKNGKKIEESACSLKSYTDGNGAQLRCWDLAENHAIPCRTGDEFEMHFVCTDEYGIQYDYTAERWVITDTTAAARWPQTAVPTITWPE